MQVSHLSSDRAHCGISSYTNDLIAALKPLGDHKRFGFSELEDKKAWKSVAKKMNDWGDVIHIQYHPHLFGYWRTPTQVYHFQKFLKYFTKPIVITLHDLLNEPPSPETMPFPKNWLFKAGVIPMLHHTPFGKWLSGDFFKAADHLIVHLGLPKEHLLHLGFDEKRISVLYPGVPLVPQVAPEKLSYKTKINLGIFGFMRPNKGYETSLQALKQLPEEIGLLCVGEPENKAYFAELKRLTRSLNLENRVNFTGYLPEDKALATLEACDVLLVPYVPVWTTASYGLSYLMASGRPIIASDIPFFKEIQTKNSDLRIFPRGNADQLAGCIRQALSHPTSGTANKAFILEWSWENVAKKTMRIYQTVLNSPRQLK